MSLSSINREFETVFSLPPRFSLKPKVTPYQSDYFGEHSFPIEYSFELAREIQTHIRANLNIEPFYDFKPLDHWSYQLSSEVYRFYIALRTYIESDKPLISTAELLNGILKGAEYITWLKKARSYIMVNSGSGFFLEDSTPEDIKIWAKDKELFDLGQMFNPRFWLFWDQPDEEDWKYFWEELKPIKQESLNELYETVLMLLPDEVEYIAEEEILLEMSGSNALDLSTFKTKKNWLLKERDNYFSSKPLLGKGSYIQKCPSDTRYSITLPVHHSNSVKLIERQLALVAAELPYSAYVKDNATYRERYERYAEKNDYHLCRDLKKDGITKVRPLIREVCRAVKDKYPEMPASKYFSIYDGFSYIGPNPRDPKGEQLNYPPRGVGLGMSSALTTILQVALFMITKKRLYEQDEDAEEVDALFYHDDATVGSKSLLSLESYNQVEDIVMSEFGQIKNRTKSFYAEWFVLCENYSNSYDLKTSYQTTVLRYAHASVNIAHAKAQWALNLQYIHSVDWRPYLNEILDHFGHEFHSEEGNAPQQHGGWVPAKYMGVDISWAYKDDHTTADMAAACATRLYPLWSKRNKKQYKGLYRSPYEKIFPNLNFGQPSDFMVGLQKFEVADSYQKYDKPGALKGFWDHQLRMRINTYNDYRKFRRTIKEWFNLYQEVHPTRDTVPPNELLIPSDEPYFEIEQAYRPANPKLAYLAFLNPGRLKKSIIPYPVPPGISIDHRSKLTSEERRQLTYTLDLLQYNNIGEIPLIKMTPRFYPNCESFFNPSAVATYMEATGRNYLPKTKNKPMLSGIRKNWTPYARVLYSSRGPLYSYLLSRNLTIPKEKLQDPTYLYEVQNALANRIHMLEKVQAYERVINESDLNDQFEPDDFFEEHGNTGFVWTDAELTDGGYWNWTTSKQNYRNWRQMYFESIREKLLLIEIEYLGIQHDTHIVKEPDYEKINFDVVEAHLWKCAGGTVVLKGDYILPEIRGFALDQEGQGYESPDVFASNSESDSGDEGNIMSGW